MTVAGRWMREKGKPEQEKIWKVPCLAVGRYLCKEAPATSGTPPSALGSIRREG
jgi:hypothetical protein